MSGGIVHVGAWDGREYEGVGGPLVLIEPQEGPFNVMEQRFRERRLKDVDLYQVACGAERGTATLHVAYPDHSSSLLRPKVKSRNEGSIQFPGKRQVVDVVTLDSIIRGSNRFDTLRIDAQGYELEVLRGATDTLFRLGRVEVEIHDPDVYDGAASLEEIDALLGAAGFTRTSYETESSDDLGDAVYLRCASQR
jgi:FkbM family methyltransferase